MAGRQRQPAPGHTLVWTGAGREATTPARGTMTVKEKDAARRRGTRCACATTWLSVAPLLALALLLTGCEYPGIPHPQAVSAAAEEPQAAETAISSPSPSPDVQTPDQQPAEPEPLLATVNVALKDFRLDPDELMAKAGTVTFVLKNDGRYTHDFRVEGNGIDEKAPKVGRGRERDWQITLPPGTYRISCPISNHSDRGMTGTLTVAE